MHIRLFLFTILCGGITLLGYYSPYQCPHPLNPPINTGTHAEAGGQCFDNHAIIEYQGFPVSWFGTLGLIFAAFTYRNHLREEKMNGVRGQIHPDQRNRSESNRKKDRKSVV